MGKLKLYRKSGAPVNLEDREKYEKAWKAFYDKADSRAKAAHNSGAYTDQYAILMARFLRYGERQLVKQYNVQVEVDMPMSQLEWTALIKKYDDTPIMVARTKEGADVVGILMDDGV